MSNTEAPKQPLTSAQPPKPDAVKQPQNLADLDAAKLKEADKTAPKKARSVKFISKTPGLVVRFGMADSDVFTFDEKCELMVTKEDAVRLGQHKFKDNGLYVEAGTVMRTATGQMVPVGQVDRDAVSAGQRMFYFPERAILEINIPGHADYPRVRLVDHKVCVPEDVAACLRRHTFFVQGRLLELRTAG